MPAPLKTVRELIRVTTDWFAGKGIDAPRLNAERLLGEVLGMTRIDLYLNHDRPVTADELDRYRELVRRRAAGEPLQQLLGETEFYGRSFKMRPGVFIPRPETELLVETCVGLLRDERMSLIAPVALEIGCGSGAVAVTLAAELPRLRVLCSDTSADAVELTRINAHRLGVAARVEPLLGDLDRPFPRELRGRVDLLVSNPPYVRTDEIDGLQPEVRDHDPRTALDGGPDGLRFYRAIATHLRQWLRPGGAVAFEIGADQADAVLEIVRAAGIAEPQVRRDYADLPRIVYGCLPGDADGAGSATGTGPAKEA